MSTGRGNARRATDPRSPELDVANVRDLVAGRGEADVAHPVLGPRLLECAHIMANQQTGSAEQILGGIDAQKLRSSMTLFLRAQPSEPVFQKVLDRYFDGEPDRATDEPLFTQTPPGKVRSSEP
jgi:uncharacterized protein (DUF1810 family)